MLICLLIFQVSTRIRNEYRCWCTNCWQNTRDCWGLCCGADACHFHYDSDNLVLEEKKMSLLQEFHSSWRKWDVWGNSGLWWVWQGWLWHKGNRRQLHVLWIIIIIIYDSWNKLINVTKKTFNKSNKESVSQFLQAITVASPDQVVEPARRRLQTLSQKSVPRVVSHGSAELLLLLLLLSELLLLYELLLLLL